MLPGYLILINMSTIGFFIFPIVSITLEELVMRIHPSYLLTLQVVCTISSQGIAALLAYAASFMFTKESRKNGLRFQFGTCVAYSLLLAGHFLTLYWQRTENKRASFIERRGAKIAAVRRRKT
jgi:hypothetical protein